MGLLSILLTVLFIGLKLTNFIAWAWIWILFPLWIWPVLHIVIYVIGFITIIFVNTFRK